MISTTSRSLMNVIVAVWILLVVAIVVVPQTTQGALVGTVSDVNGARVPGATVSASAVGSSLRRQTTTNSEGEFRLEGLPPGDYRITVSAPNFSTVTYALRLNVNSYPTLPFILKPGHVTATVQVPEGESTLYSQPLETTSSVEKTVISKKDLANIPLAHRSFANIAYLAPMTQPVEPSDPTKARITAVAFGGSSGLNVDLSVDGGDNNDDYIGGFLQNYSPDAMQEFVVRTSQFDADTARTNGGSVIISTRRGTDQWHGDFGYYLRARAFNARNKLDNPEPNPKQPFSRQNGIAAVGGPLKTEKLWLFSSLEYVHENASVAYSALSLNEFRALARLASLGLIPGVTSIDVPTSVPVPFRDVLFSTRVDWFQSARSQWFFRGSLDRNNTHNDLIQQATLPSTGAFTRSNYYSFLVDNQFLFNSKWSGTLTVQANNFHHTKERNSHIGLALAFPFSTTAITTSGFETFGDNQFVTGITAFPIRRDQRKYQFRYDVARVGGKHAVKFGVNFIHEPVLSGRLADDAETLVAFPQGPS
ncbi:MAG: carboxypeptidase-like regulatory domain-containing protein, partial [Acidobacteriota bacterium]|nr:carboxypeptidase-like regulatory domain-containing protein [Acidobacteriota bacterium]